MGEFDPLEDEDFEINTPPEWEAGVYANASDVTFTTREFTLDFIRINPYRNSGVLVARISCSSDAATELLLNLESQLRLWAERVLSDREGDGNGHAL
jgi:hypothetical protein